MHGLKTSARGFCVNISCRFSGPGIVATEHEQRTVSVGDVILFPKGEKHWHGAAEDSEFSHIFITKTGGRNYIQMED